MHLPVRSGLPGADSAAAATDALTFLEPLDLAARGSSTQHVMQVSGFILPGLMMAAFGVLLGRTGSRLAGIASALLVVSGLARAAAGVFVPDPLDSTLPLSFDEQMHDAAGLSYMLTFILAVVTWTVASAASARRSAS